MAIALAIGPALLHPTHTVVGSPTVDGYGTQWFYWFAGEVLGGRQSLGWTDRLFFPWGKDIYAHTGANVLDAWLAWPLRAALGPVAGYDAWIVLVLATNAWAGARLAAAWGVPAGRRWPAGLALVLNPYVLCELDFGRPTQAWLAPAALCVAALVSMRRARDAAVAGGAMAVAALTYWYYGLLLGALAVLHGAWRAVAGPARGRATALHVLAALVALGATLPFAWPMLTALRQGAVPGLLALDGTGPIAPLALHTVEGDAQGLFVLAPLLAGAGSLLDDGGLRYAPGVGALAVVHLAVLAIGLWLLVGARPAPGVARTAGLTRWGWMVPGVVLALLIASGPLFVYGDGGLPNRPFIALVTHVDLLRRWWWPGRAVVLVHVLAAPLVAVILDRVGPRARVLVGAGLLLATVAPLRRDALLPVGSWDATVSPVLTCLAAAPAGAVIDVPLLSDQKNLWFQTVHEKPILGGMLLKKAAFAPPALAALRRDNVLLADLLAIGDHEFARPPAPVDPGALAALQALGYRYVLARADAFRRPATDRAGAVSWESEWSRPRRLLVALLGAPATEDDTLALWRLGGEPLACP